MVDLEQRISTWVDAEVGRVAPVTVDEALARAGQGPLGPEPAPATRGRPRTLALLAAAAVLVVAVIVITRPDAPKESVRAGEAGWATYREPSFGWTLEHPDDWTTQSWPTTCVGDDVAGSLITNRTEVIDLLTLPDITIEGEPSCEWDPAQLTAPGFVGMEITHDESAQPLLGSPAQTERPLQRQEMRSLGDAPAGTQQWTDQITIGNDRWYTITVWAADDASRADLRRLDRMIESISWPDPPPVDQQATTVSATGGPHAGTFLTCMADRGYHPRQELLPRTHDEAKVVAEVTWAAGEADRSTYGEDRTACAERADAAVNRFQMEFGPWPDRPGASQSPADAERDGVISPVAELPLRERATPTTWFDTAEGTWALSRMPAPDSADGSHDCVLGDPEGTWGEDYICSDEYGEVLLVDGEGAIVRAYPMPGLVPTWLYATEDAVYAGRSGDGGAPDSTVVRIDRVTLEPRIVLFPHGDGILAVGFPNWSQAPDGMSIGDLVRVVSPDGPVDPDRTFASSWVGVTAIDLAAIEELFA